LFAGTRFRALGELAAFYSGAARRSKLRLYDGCGFVIWVWGLGDCLYGEISEGETGCGCTEADGTE
jgi:hypothetical protein